MAPRLTADERAEVQRFVISLYEQSGTRSWADFARRVGVSEYSLAEWRSGRGTPNALNLIRMLQGAGALNGDVTHQDPLESLAAKVAELALGQAQILRVLGQESATQLGDTRKRRQASPKR